MSSLDGSGLHALLSELSDPATTAERAEVLMASLDGLEAPALPTVFRWLHDAPDEDALHAATRLLVRWRDSAAAKALPPALRALVREPEAGDLNKIAAAGVLAVLGEPLHDADLARYLRDPVAVKLAALRRLLDRRQGRLSIVNTIDRLAERSPEAILPLVDDLVELGDPAGARILVPLAHHTDADVAVSAVAALDQIGARRAAPALRLLAQHHGAPGVRSQAALTAARLEEDGPVEPAERNGQAAPPSGQAQGCAVRAVSLPTGRRVFLLSAPSPFAAGERELLTLHVDEEVGIVESAFTERVPEGAMEAIEARLSSAGAEVEAWSGPQALAALEAASARTLVGMRADAPLGWTAWRELLAPVG
jgi:hypothetical protein